MYIVLDVPTMMKTSTQTRRRQKPIRGYNSTLLLRPGTDIQHIPPGSEIRYANGSWEVHTPIANKKIVENMAKTLDAVAYMC
jgi:hypothetical protein